jgi:signal transduction histidine kinase
MVLLADPGQLQQAITNLVLNAIQASEPGQEVTIDAELTQVKQGKSQNEFVVFRVTDRGPGIPKDRRERIFEPFYTTKPPGEGTGLGLSVVREIAQEHGGSVEVSSEPGEGATFKLYLPRDAADASQSADR